jgi:phosphotriesterase-related protein
MPDSVNGCRVPVNGQGGGAGVALLAVGLLVSEAGAAPAAWTYAVSGRVPTRDLGVTLIHEHVLVDFVGADKVTRSRYDADAVFRKVLPHLTALEAAGARTLVECTPAYIGRDPRLLQRLGTASRLRIVTNTGIYGAAKDKYVPDFAWNESAAELARRWTKEFKNGIEGTKIRPGFLKSGVDAGPLQGVDQKLVRAAALCHRKTGLSIFVHTGDGTAAMDIITLLRQEGVLPSAYVWVHAQSEKDRKLHLRAAEEGAWLSFDGVSPERLSSHVETVAALIAAGHIGRLLVSQDAGWYHVGEADGGSFRPYTFLLESFVPALRAKGITEDQVTTLLVANPARALAIEKRLAPRR